MRLGIATCSEKPEITAADRLAAEAAARVLDAELVAVPWDLPSPPATDALVVRSTWGYHHHVERFRGWLRSLRGPVLNPVPLLLGNLDKAYLFDLEESGVPLVPSFLFRDPAELAAGLRQRGWNEVVLKPAVSASSHLTFRLGARDAAAAGAKVLTRSAGIVQPFLREILGEGELSAVYHKARGEAPRFSHALRKVPARGDFRVQAEFGGKVLPYAPNAAARAFCELTLSKVEGEWLYARVDFVEIDGKARLCELELVEPYLFYDLPGADLEGFARSLASHLAP